MSARVLVVEDEAAVRELVAFHLRRGGFEVLEAASAADAWPLLEQSDLIVLDRMLPDEEGTGFVRRLRTLQGPAAFQGGAKLPVLMLTARASEVDRVDGLEAGADDYLTKPFSAAELIARVRALLRRTRPSRRHRFGDLIIDEDQGVVLVHGERRELTRREFALLAYLAAHPGRVFSRTELLDAVWGEDFLGTERTVDQHVAQLRAALRDAVGNGSIETVRGRGYRFVVPT